MANYDTKKLWESKTFWIGVLTTLGGVLSAIAGELQTGATLTVAGIIQIVLRTVTKQGVTL